MDKGPGLPSADPGDQDIGSRCPTMTDGQSATSSGGASFAAPPALSVSQSVDDQDAHEIEKYRTEQRHNPQSRPVTSWSQAPSGTSTPRHIDLLEALFTSHRYQIESAKTLSPTTPYNEDIAERNMTRFLRGQPSASVYSRLVSALYQEDVASRNIDKGRKSGRSFPRLRSRSPGHTPQSNPQGRRHDANGRPVSRGKGGQMAAPARKDARSVSHSLAEGSDTITQEQWRRCNHYLRPQMSEPNLSAEPDASRTPVVPNSIGHLGVPPAYKQGNRLSRSPVPDSPTIPIPSRRDKRKNGHNPDLRIPPDRTSSLNSANSSPSSSPASSSRRNIRDLSINTDVASRGKTASRIAHRAIQPPTPSALDAKQNPSIAEVMNNPLPEGTPTSISPAPIPSEKLAEMMDMFKQANVSTQATNSQATFESLQDTIVREVNSHEAFRRVPVPKPGPPFTPSPTRDTFARASNPELRRSVSAKEGQLAKLVRRGSPKGHRRSSESRMSISSVLPKTSDKLFRFAPGSTRRRRHTDAPLPSAGFFDADSSKQQGGSPSQDNQVTYMDVLSRASNNSTPQRPNPNRSSSTDSRNLHRFQSTQSVPKKSPERLPSVYYMRAQSSTSTHESRRLLHVEDSDDEVIHLPSSNETRRPQVHGVDKNNVKYIVNNSTPSDAYRLMNWPQKCRRASNTSDESAILSETNSFPLPPRSTQGRQLRVSRSIDP